MSPQGWVSVPSAWAAGAANPVWEHPRASFPAVDFFSPGAAPQLVNTRFSVSSLRLRDKSRSAHCGFQP